MEQVNGWFVAILIYLFLVILTFIPIIKAILKKVKLNPSGTSFDDSPHFSEDAKKLLNQHYSRINGTLVFWKNEAEKYKLFHYYCMFWTIPISILIPITTQYVDSDFYSKLFLTIISCHTAILIAFHRGLKTEENYKAFRNGESDFYDIYRRLLDNPKSFGENENTQIEKYFNEVEVIRKLVRGAEINNFPTLEDVKNTFNSETKRN